MPKTCGGKIAGKMMTTFCIFPRKTFEILVSYSVISVYAAEKHMLLTDQITCPGCCLYITKRIQLTIITPITIVVQVITLAFSLVPPY
jgi:hypothetical protein